jgi:hypothetical protein
MLQQVIFIFCRRQEIQLLWQLCWRQWLLGNQF